MKSTGLVAHQYPRWRAMFALTGQDVLLAVAPAVLVLFSPYATLAKALLLAIPLVFGFGIATLHYPARVEIDDEGISFARYGRVHRFLWHEIERIHIRRFLVRDRVLVRISPSKPFRGRYWILDSIEGFADLVRAIEARDPR
jgi:hypothetical protein